MTLTALAKARRDMELDEWDKLGLMLFLVFVVLPVAVVVHCIQTVRDTAGRVFNG